MSASRAYKKWIGERGAKLDEIVDAHRAVGGAGRGRRYATEQINHAYAVLLSSAFQAFCRDLHSEAIDHIVGVVTAPSVQSILRTRLLENRFVDKGNPNPGNLGSDFGRFGFNFWDGVLAQSARNKGRLRVLERLNQWRNAIAHQDFAAQQLSDARLHLKTVNVWRSACSALARDFDKVVERQLTVLVGKPPW